MTGFQFYQATTPNIWPTPAVKAIAKAPQNVTRMDALSIGAPPACAAMLPKTARNTSESMATMVISCESGISQAVIKGNAAPTVKVAADERAAWMGRALVLSIIPISSLACAPSASCSMSCAAT